MYILICSFLGAARTERTCFGNLFLENEHGNLELSLEQAFFSKWLPRAKHYAHEMRSEILFKTRSPFSEIFHHDPETVGKPPSIVSWSECQCFLGSSVLFFYRRILFFLSQRIIFLSSYFSNLVRLVLCQVSLIMVITCLGKLQLTESLQIPGIR